MEEERNEERHHAIITPGALVIPLSEELQHQARHCLERSGSVRFTFKEISVTSLRGIVELEDNVIIE